MKKSVLSFVLAAAVVVGGLTVYASAQKKDAKEEAVRTSYASAAMAKAEGVVQRKAALDEQRDEAAAAAEKEAQAAVEAKKAQEEAEAKMKAEAEAAAKKKAEEEAARKKAEEEAAAAAQKQAEEAAAAAAVAAAQQADNYSAPAAVQDTAVQAPAEPVVNTQAVYQPPLCPYGHELVNGNMCGYADCPNGYCPNNNYSYSSGAQNVDYGYSGGYQGGGYCNNYGHGGGHHGHGCW